MADLLALDERIEEGRREQRCILVATFADVRHFMEDFVELYPAAAPLAGAAWDDVRSLARIEPLDPWDLGRALYVLFTAFMVGTMCPRTRPARHSIREVMGLPGLLVRALDAGSSLDRSRFLSRLRQDCLPWPSGNAPGYHRPRRFLTRLARAVEDRTP